MSGFDHGMLNLPLGHRGRGKSIDRTIDDAVREVARQRRADNEAAAGRARELRKAEKDRKKLTREDCEGALLVRDEFGWHRIIRVNAKTVTVATPYSWTETIPYAKILETRR
jgi:hypothetical protein